MNEKLILSDLKKQFEYRPFSKQELYNFYLLYEPELKESTFRWRVHRLRNENIIIDVKRGIYKLHDNNHLYYVQNVFEKNEYNPYIENKTMIIFKNIKNNFHYAKFSIWNTKWLHEFMIHQPINNTTIIEVEKIAAKSVFESLQDLYENVYLNPSKYEIDKYLLSGKSNILVINLVMDSPLQVINKITVPKIEKIIVDLFANKSLFVMYQGKELANILEGIFEKYDINMATLKRYATRRNVKNKIIEFLSLSTNIEYEKYMYLRG
ncbi:hypothetical protein HZF24_03810 [Sedimentibacter hydroxybenzoicus DSM 7310]|uniref:Uncharacterized protein n=1 Tax=Sedimentibacter hydroxybenzoicus DSM 7310 TaxID=1123245 RepID=A0A974BHH6_SEDHY|nr:DUF6577 family protein [Sedimentibacter hydroxybenzoicus]NYB73260.1 hypothetical protein [Sedimentibacter hydroxybenzoicus DSM 7310]